VDTGLVVMDERGDPSRPEYLALGEAPNVASRLQGLAVPGTMVVSEATHQLTEGFFICEALGDFQLKGMVKSLSVYRVVQASGAQSRFDVAMARGLTPLADREQEIGILLERWEQVKEGQGHVVMLSGEAGIGKSRIIKELKDRLDHPAAVLECRCSPYHQGTAFYPLIDFLQRTLHWRDDESATVKQQKLEAFVTQYRLGQAESVSLLALLLSLPLPDDQYPPFEVSSQKQRQKMLEILLALLVEQAKQQPVMFIIEDLHWIDPSTLEFLDLLIAQGPMVAILTVLTCRLTFASPWGLRTHITPVALSRLSRVHVGTMITSVTGGKILPSGIVEQLFTKTDGVALFVEELTKTVVESGWFDESANRYELRGSLQSLKIPATLQDSLMARLDRLAPGKEVAQLAATIGRQFSYDLLRAVAPWDDITLHEGLRQLVEAELCYQHGVLPQANYLFKHALIRDIAYDSLLRSRRRQIHGNIARVLESDPRFQAREPETIARHYEAAQEMEQAIVYWERAGHQARQRSANQEAASHFVHAIDLLHAMREARERAELELRLRIELGGQLIACHGNGALEVEENYDRAHALLASVHDRQLTFRARHGLRTFYIVRGPLQKAKELGDQLLELAHELGDDSLLLQAHRPHGLCLFAMGELKPARYHLERAVVLYRSEAHSTQRFEYISDPLVLARCNLGWLTCFLGEREGALDQTDRAIAFAEALDHPHSLAFALSLAASTRQALGMIEETQSLAERTLSLSKSYGYPYWIAWAQMLLGWVCGRSGDPNQGAEELQHGLSSYRETGARMMLPYFLVLLAEMDLQRREPDQALSHLAEARRLIDITDTRFYEAELHRLMGCLLVELRNEPDHARQSFLQAIDIAASQGNVLFQTAAQRSLDALLGA
jgi:tetratricopeptide (TPR) repeat protein